MAEIKSVDVLANGNIVIDGVDKLLDDLDKYESKDLKDSLFKEMVKIANPIVKDAQFFLPDMANQLSNWGGKNTAQQINTGQVIRGFGGFPIYNDKSADRGIRAVPGKKRSKGRTKSFYMALLTVASRDAAAMVFEWAGKQTNSVFAQNLTNKFGRAFRALYPAVDKNIDQVHKGVEDAIMFTDAELNQRLKSRS